MEWWHGGLNIWEGDLGEEGALFQLDWLAPMLEDLPSVARGGVVFGLQLRVCPSALVGWLPSFGRCSLPKLLWLVGCNLVGDVGVGVGHVSNTSSVCPDMSHCGEASQVWS